jgi:hypothetical protein
MVPRGIQGTIGLTGLTGNHRIQGGWKSISKLVPKENREYKESEADNGLQGTAGPDGAGGAKGDTGIKGDTGATGSLASPGVLETTVHWCQRSRNTRNSGRRYWFKELQDLMQQKVTEYRSQVTGNDLRSWSKGDPGIRGDTGLREQT